MADKGLQGKLALVTGSTSGIGLGMAKALAQRGCNLVINGFGDQAEIDRLVKSLADTNRVKVVFEGAGGCVGCHSGKHFTDANTRLHPPSDSMAEPETPSYAARSATKMYRTTPLRALWQHAPYFHDGSAATLADVVALYNARRGLNLTAQQASDLVEYLKSL